MRKLHKFITIAMTVLMTTASYNVSFASSHHRLFKSKKSLEALDTTKNTSNEKVKSIKIEKDGKSAKNRNINARVKKLLDCAKQYTGVPYHFGGSTPSGFDCSGYLRYVFKESCGIELPHAADEQYSLGENVKQNNLQPGDLVFFTTYESGISHSGIYVGDGKFISATTSSGVAIADMTSGYWHNRYCGAKRVL